MLSLIPPQDEADNSWRIDGESHQEFRGVPRRRSRVVTIEKGEFLTLLGPSWSGKTTLLMMIAGFHDITAGDILLDGASIARLPAEKRNFGMVFQGYAPFPHMNVR